MLLFLFHNPPLKSWLTFYIGWGHNSNVQWVPRCSENKLELWKSELYHWNHIVLHRSAVFPALLFLAHFLLVKCISLSGFLRVIGVHWSWVFFNSFSPKGEILKHFVMYHKYILRISEHRTSTFIAYTYYTDHATVVIRLDNKYGRLKDNIINVCRTPPTLLLRLPDSIHSSPRRSMMPRSVETQRLCEQSKTKEARFGLAILGLS